MNRQDPKAPREPIPEETVIPWCLRALGVKHKDRLMPPTTTPGHQRLVTSN
jgi:hypothetical protein